MVRMWFMDDLDEDQRLEHHINPPRFLDLSTLQQRTGVEYFKVWYTVVLNDESVEMCLTIAGNYYLFATHQPIATLLIFSCLITFLLNSRRGRVKLFYLRSYFCLLYQSTGTVPR